MKLVSFHGLAWRTSALVPVYNYFNNKFRAQLKECTFQKPKTNTL